MSIKFGDIWLDIQKWRAVEHIHVLDVHNAVFDLVQLNNRKPNWIRRLGRTGGKESLWFRTQEGLNDQTESVGAMKKVQENDVRESIRNFSLLIDKAKK